MTKLYNLIKAVTTWRKLALATVFSLTGLAAAHAQCTPPIISTFPYLENFDGVSSGTLPCGVTVLNSNNDAETWAVLNVGTDAASVPNAMVYIYNEDGTTGANDWFFTPAIAMRTGYRYSLQFKYKSIDADYVEKMEVRYGPSATVAGQTNLLWQNNNITNPTYTTTVNGTGADQVNYITPGTNGTYYIGFHATSDADQFALLVDDVQVVEELASCLSPTNLAVTNTTATGATVSFTGTGTGNSYTVIYGPRGFNPATAGTSVTTTTSPVTLAGLTSNTNYDVYVRSTCGSTASTLTGPVAFSTLCVATTVSTYPYNEGFDGVAAGTLPCGVTVLNVNGDARTWRVASTYQNGPYTIPVSSSPPNAMLYEYNSALAANDWFFTSALAMRAGYRYQLSFKYRVSDPLYPEKLEVKYGTAATVAGQTTTLWNNSNITVATYTTAGASSTPAVALITPTTNGTYYIGFHVDSDADQFLLLVDDLQVTETLVTATKSEELSRAIEVYPNPSKGIFNLNVAGTKSKAATLKLQVSNQLGQIVHEGAVKNADKNILNLSTLKAGIYNLKVQDGDDFTVRRLVIE